MTEKQLQSAINVAEKNMEKARRNIETYQIRRDRAIEKAVKRGYGLNIDCFEVNTIHIPVSRDGSTITRQEVRYSGDGPFDVYYSVVNAWEMMLENMRKLESVENRLSQLHKELDALHKVAQHVDSLVEPLEQAMSEFKVAWFDKMKTWHRNHYAYINRGLDVTRKRKDRMVDIVKRHFSQYGYGFMRKSSIAKAHHGRIYLSLNNQIKEAIAILSDKAAGLSLDDYMQYAEDSLNRNWSYCMSVLVDKLKKFNVNVESVKVSGTRVTDKGFECLIVDGSPRIIHARLIWAAEDSDLVCPHTRYIVTERRK